MSLRIALAQLDFLVGDVPGNAARMVAAARQARADPQSRHRRFPGARAVGLPARGSAVPSRLSPQGRRRPGKPAHAKWPASPSSSAIPSTAGRRSTTPPRSSRRRAARQSPQDRAAQLQGVRREALLHRRRRRRRSWNARDFASACSMCEDIWEAAAAQLARDAGAELLVVINASPYRAAQAARAGEHRARSRAGRAACRSPT